MDFVLRLAQGDAEVDSLDRHDLVLGLQRHLKTVMVVPEPNGCAMITNLSRSTASQTGSPVACDAERTL